MTAMANEAQPCRLLELPREVRNLIYGHLMSDNVVLITKPVESDEDPNNTAHLANAPLVSVFSVCKQIHDEYKDSCYKEAALYIYAVQPRLARSSFNFKPSVPKKLFKNVSVCLVKIAFGMLQGIVGEPEQLTGFIDDMEAGETEEDTFEREWTPSKGSCSSPSLLAVGC